MSDKVTTNNNSIFANNKSLALDALRRAKNARDIMSVLDMIADDVKGE